MTKKTSPQVLLHFGAHHLDLGHQRLWHGSTAVDLRPKAWQALVQLLQRPGVLVTGDELLEALWPNADVTPKTLTNLMGELRRALGDDLSKPQIIQTVHRRGYRLIAPVHSGSVAPGATAQAVAYKSVRPISPVLVNGPLALAAHAARPLVGRTTELAAMSRLLGQAFEGQRRVLLLGGDPGVGKTALLDAFVAQLGPMGVMFGRGQCVEQAGEREAFGPVLGLLAHLTSGPDGAHALPQLRRCAPSWLVQMPWLLGEAGANEAQQLRRSLAGAGAGAGRMVREFCALVDALAQQTPLVLVLEDLHWADAATVDLLTAIAQQQAPARLLLLASHQPVEAAVRGHPLVAAVRRLQAQGQLQRLDLQALDATSVRDLLDQRFHNPELTRQLATLALQRSAGNPLFLTAVLDHLVERGWVQLGDEADASTPADHGRRVQRWQLKVDLHRLDLDLPEHLRLMVAARFESLDASTLQMLQAASAIGIDFNMQLLEAAAGQARLTLESACHELARKQMFLRALPPSTWPDGSTGSAYAFVHDVYRRVLYDALPLPVQQLTHRRVAERLERGYGPRAAEVAGALASAYSRAAQPEATARVLEMAAVVSYQRFAAVEAAAALEASLQQLALVPDSDDRVRTETRLYLTLGPVTLAAHGMAHPRALQAYETAQALARRTGAKRELIRGLLGACLVHAMVGRPETGRQLALEFVPLAQAHQPTLAAVAHTYAGLVELGTGHLAQAQPHLEQALQLVPEPGIPMYMDLHSIAHTQLGRTLCHRGRLNEGLAQLAAAVARCRASGATNDLVQALYWTADTQRGLGLNAAAAANFDEMLPLAEQHGMVTFITPARIGRLVVRPGDTDPAALHLLVQQYRASGDRWADVSFSVLLAEAHAARGDTQAALAALQAGFEAVDTGALFHAELHRAKADVLARAGAPAAAVEEALTQALAVAQRQQAHWHGLRSAHAMQVCLARNGEHKRGRDVLAAACAAVDGPLECPYLQAAQALLAIA